MQLISGIPLAALGDVIEVVLPIIFVVFYVLSQILSGREQAKRKAPPRPQRPKPPQALDPARPAPPQPPNQADALRREVEQFLRRAQGKPELQEEPARPKPEPQAPPRRLVANAPKGPAASWAPLPSQISRKASQPSSSAPNLREEGVAEHVAEHISSRKLVEHAEHLGSQIALADERLESRLHEKFDHQLGKLQRQATTEPKKQEEPNIAAQIAEMLSQPDGMRQMIVANEILRRPDERWDRG